MNSKRIYLALAAGGVGVQGILLSLFVAQNGLNLVLLLRLLFANPATSLAMADLLLSAVVFWFFVFRTARREDIARPAIYVAASLVGGLCLALPLFLYAREARLDQSRAVRPSPPDMGAQTTDR